MIKTHAALLALALILPHGTAAQQPTAATSADSLLNRLVGRWRMTGTVQGESASSNLEAARVLQGRWIRLHMVDRATPPDYEADVYLAVDSASGRIVAHWIDVFGASYSTTLGYGERRGNTLVLDFAYPDGPFRDTFTWDPAAGSWRFLLESGDGKGGWTPFADYVVRKESR